MKNFNFWVIACLLGFCCCSETENEISTPDLEEVLYPVRFTIDLQKEVVPFPETKSIPALDVGEPAAVNADDDESDTESEDLYNRIDYIVYDDEDPTTILKHRQYTPEDEDFTIVYDSLPAGNYHICFFAHSDKGISVSGRTASFSQVYDTFHLYQALTVEAGQEISQDVILRRIVSKIEFVSSDAVPEDLASFTMMVSDYPKEIDVTTGGGISTTTYTQTDTFSDEDVGQAGSTHAFFTFVTEDEETFDVTLTAVNQSGEILRERDVLGVQPIRSYIIRYTGILFTPKESDDTFTIDLLNEGEWETDNRVLSDDDD